MNKEVISYDALAQVEAGGYFHYDATQDKYFYKDEANDVDLQMKIYIIKDYYTQLSDEGVFKYALVVDVRNAKYL